MSDEKSLATRWENESAMAQDGMTLDRRTRYLVISIAFHGGLVGRCRGLGFEQGM